MASIQQVPGRTFHICFRYGKQRFKRSLQTTNRRKADAAAVRVAETIFEDCKDPAMSTAATQVRGGDRSLRAIAGATISTVSVSAGVLIRSLSCHGRQRPPFRDDYIFFALASNSSVASTCSHEKLSRPKCP